MPCVFNCKTLLRQIASMTLLSVPARLIDIYRYGFGNSQLARRLLWIIIIKVVILFAVFRLFLMPNQLSANYDTGEEKAQSVRSSLIDRSK